MISSHFSSEYKNFENQKDEKNHYVSDAYNVLNHIRPHEAFLSLLTLSLVDSFSFLFYLFRLSTSVLEARRDFAAIYFMRVTSFSALSLPPIVAYLPQQSLPKTHPRGILMELDSVRYTHLHACVLRVRVNCTTTCWFLSPRRPRMFSSALISR